MKMQEATERTDRRYFNTAEIAEICDVSIVCVGNWIRTGKLRAYRPPRGHYRVSQEDLLEFLEANGMPVPRTVAGRSALRVLVVDDEPMVRAVVANLLEAVGGMEVFTAADGFGAGKLVVDLQPDAVILDLRMPGLDGATVCQRIKNDPRTADTRVLFLTGYTDPDNLNLIRACGADGYIAKPFAAKDLIEAVRGLVPAVAFPPVASGDARLADKSPTRQTRYGDGAPPPTPDSLSPAASP